RWATASASSACGRAARPRSAARCWPPTARPSIAQSRPTGSSSAASPSRSWPPLSRWSPAGPAERCGASGRRGLGVDARGGRSTMEKDRFRCRSPEPEGATMKYLFLLYGGHAELPQPGTEEFGRMLAEWGAAKQAMADAGVLIECSRLQPPSASTTVRVRGGETLLTDGPAAEIKEGFGGSTVVEGGRDR